MLDLVEHDQSLERLERRHRLTESSNATRILEVKVVRVSGREKLASEGCLSALAWAQQRNHGRPAKRLFDLLFKFFTRDHSRFVS